MVNSLKSKMEIHSEFIKFYAENTGKDDVEQWWKILEIYSFLSCKKESMFFLI